MSAVPVVIATGTAHVAGGHRRRRLTATGAAVLGLAAPTITA